METIGSNEFLKAKLTKLSVCLKKLKPPDPVSLLRRVMCYVTEARESVWAVVWAAQMEGRLPYCW